MHWKADMEFEWWWASQSRRSDMVTIPEINSLVFLMGYYAHLYRPEHELTLRMSGDDKRELLRLIGRDSKAVRAAAKGKKETRTQTKE